MVLPLKILRAALPVACFFSYGLLAPASANTEESDTANLEASISPASHAFSRKLDINIVLENHLSAIEQKENEAGPYDSELSEMVYGLGRTLQISQRYSEAISAYKRSLYLKRINNGVYSLSQAPMLRGMIESHIRQGEIDEAAKNYEQLIWIHLKTYDENDVRLLPLLNEVSQWHLSAYTLTEQREDGYHLDMAFDLYSMAIRLSSEHYGPSNLELVNLLKNLAITSYYQTLHQQRYPEFSELGTSVPFGYRPFGTSGDEMLRRGSYYLHGRAAHKRIVEILSKNPDVTPIDQAKAQAHLGDWYQLHGHYRLALGAYQKAHQVMNSEEQREEVLTELFGMPTMLPTLETRIIAVKTPPTQTIENTFSAENSGGDERSNGLSHASTVVHDSYVNISVDVTKKGTAKNLKIEKIYPEGASKYGHRASQTIRTRKFRPRFEGGLPVPTHAFPIRVLIPHENS